MTTQNETFNAIFNKLNAPVKGKETSKKTAMEFLQALPDKEIGPDTLITIASAALYSNAASLAHDWVYWSQGFIAKQYKEGLESGGTVTKGEVLPGHVLNSQEFEETYLSRALMEKGDEISQYLTEKIPQKLKAYFSLKANKENLGELCAIYPELSEIVFDDEYRATLQTLKDKEKESQALLDYLKGLGLSPKLFRERAATFTCSGEQAKILSQAIVIPNGWERKVITGKGENTFAKFWSSLNGNGGLGYEKIEVDFELSFNCLLSIPAGFEFPTN